jgi:hypothetical protein
MIHLKRFNESDQSEYYEEIKLSNNMETEEKFSELWWKAIPIGKRWTDRLERTFSDRFDGKMSDSRTFGKGFLIGTAYYDNIFPQIQMMKPGIWMSFETEDVFVWEMEDQYFLVIILPFEGEKRSVLFPPRRASYKNATFWKCDQIEGIERLISDSIENN